MTEITAKKSSTRRAATAPIPSGQAGPAQLLPGKRPGDHGTRHDGPATIKLVNLRPLYP